jgi:hypothetical protein
MLLIIIVVLIAIMSVSALAFMYLKSNKKLIEKTRLFSSVIYEDVVLRLEESIHSECPLISLRKVREAHASLESISGIVGGFESLENLVDVDVEDLDERISLQEKKLKKIHFEYYEIAALTKKVK